MSIEIGLIALLVVLVLLAAVLAAAEVSLLRATRVTLELESDEGRTRARTVIRLLDELPLVLNTVLLTVLLIQVSAAAITGYLANQWFGGIATTVATLALTVVLFVYTEAIPKTLALRRPHQSAKALGRPVALLVKLVRPATRTLLAIADAQTPGAGATAQTAFTEDELRMLAEQSAEAGQIEPEDAVLVRRSFEFGDCRVADVLVPRRDIVATHASTTPSQALDTAVASGHRRLPVILGDLDDVIGIVRIRDLAAAIDAGEPSSVEHLVRPTLRVEPELPVADLLGLMQDSGHRFAVVTGSSGATEGIVTVEDIVAELVGEIEEPD